MKIGTSTQRPVRRMLPLVVAGVLCLPAGTLCHEIIGHGLTGVALGGRITYVEVLGLRLWPEPGLVGWPAAYGYCGVEDLTPGWREAVMGLGGSVSTLLASLVALAALRIRRWSVWPRVILLAIGLWWVDLLTYTLPVWGLRRSIFWGGRISEPYEAAVMLGVPGGLWQVFVVVACGSCAIAWVWAMRRAWCASATPVSL
jgi:hypothetical protein